MLLGTSLIKCQAMNNNLASQCNDLERATSRLGLLSAHDAFVLLRPLVPHSFNTLCVHLQVTTMNIMLIKFDQLLQTAYSKICNVSLSNDQ